MVHKVKNVAGILTTAGINHIQMANWKARRQVQKSTLMQINSPRLIACTVLGAICVSTSSCSEIKSIKNKNRELSGIIYSTNSDELERYFVAPIVALDSDYNVYKPFDVDSMHRAVLRGIELYNDVYREKGMDLNSYSNMLLSKLVRREPFILTKAQYDKLKPKLISPRTGKMHYKVITRILKHNRRTHGTYLNILNAAHQPNQRNRVLIYNFIINGYRVEIDDESGLAYISKSELLGF